MIRGEAGFEMLGTVDGRRVSFAGQAVDIVMQPFQQFLRVIVDIAGCIQLCIQFGQ
jgi:hypothetical protein